MSRGLKVKIVFVILIACILTGFFSFSANCQSRVIADSLIQLLNENDHWNDTLKCHHYNEVSFYATDPDERIYYAELAVETAKRINSDRQLALGMRYIGMGHSKKGDLSTAIEKYLIAAKCYANIKLDLGVAVVYLDLADVYSIQNNFTTADKYYQKSIKIFRHKNDSIRLASALLNLGELYRLNKKLDSAIQYFEESMIVFETVDYPSRVAYARGNIGLVQEVKGQYIEAERNLKGAIFILSEFEDYDPISTYQLALSRIEASRGSERIALSYADSALAIGLNEGLKEQIRDASLQLSELYSSQSNFKKAHYFQSQYITYRDSINNEETVRKMADLRTEFEVGLKQAEVDLKQKEVDLLQKEAYISRVLLAAGGVFVILLLVVVVVLWQLYHMKVRAANVVRRKRQVIEGQHRRVLQLNATKDRFFSIISHDLRGPISNFSGVAGLIQLYIEDGDYVELKRIGRILENSSHELSTLLDNLLDWAMNQQGVFPYDPEEVSAEEICNPTLRVLSNSANAKNITMTEEVHSEYMVYVDVNSATTTIRNLVSNALKFTPEGGTVTLTVEREGDYAVFVVEDNGIGIPEDKMKNLFGFDGERKRWGTDGEKGVGLGLNLVREFVELNKGKVTVTSKESQGSCFRVYFPLFVEE
ncbi:Signal transduction histidine kinase [Reichenbachiella agariperforans]|uniref:histidine kinase n=2 Tax=Reichenbachiella agariperforans TaxID=156994 RepID=A0A1M6WBI7_REIAG|nr:Signal transduction histidine kinase [Reichenbachiella agariperforans]